MTIKEVKEKIRDNDFKCSDALALDCNDCPFNPGYMEGCGGHSYDFNWKKIKESKTVTMKTLIKFKIKTNKLKYPKL